MKIISIVILSAFCVSAFCLSTEPVSANNFIYVPPSDTYVYNYVYIRPQPYVIQAPPRIIYRYVQPGRDPQTGQCYNLDLC